MSGWSVGKLNYVVGVVLLLMIHVDSIRLFSATHKRYHLNML